jgi:heme exporter protein D
MSLADFFTMGGYGGYVWGAYGLTAVVIAAEIGAVLARLRNARSAARTDEVAS